MIKPGKLLMALLTAAAIANPITAAESSDPDANETAAQHDARMEWWREARFGMFSDWGVYAVTAGTYNGKQIGRGNIVRGILPKNLTTRDRIQAAFTNT